MLGPCGPLVCWCGYPCRGVLNTPHRAPRHGADDHTRRPSIRARGPVWWAYAVAPRGFAAQGFALGYGPPGLQPGRVRPIRALRPGWEGVFNTPLHGYMHSGLFGYPAKFAGVRRRPPLHRYVHSGPFGYPASFAGVRRRPEASETLKQLVWAFPRPRKP